MFKLTKFSELNRTSIPGVATVGPFVLVVTDLKGHPRSIIFIYATSY